MQQSSLSPHEGVEMDNIIIKHRSSLFWGDVSRFLIRQDFSNDLWLSFYLHALINH
jgi:hypothetical protein